MKKFLTATAALMALAAPAMAADIPVAMPVKAPVLVPIVYNWTGFYIGGHIGGIWGRSDLHDNSGYNGAAGAGDFSYRLRGGVMGGLHAGYNWQVNAFVFGIEGEGGYLGLRGSAQFPPYVGVRTPADSVATTDDGWYAAITGRLGIAFNNWLLFAKGGWVTTGVNNSFTDTDPIGITLVSGTTTSHRNGWTLGGGIEYAFTNNVSARLEYAHYDFGTRSHTALGSNGVLYNFGHRLKADSLRIGLSYHFAPTAVIARY